MSRIMISLVCAFMLSLPTLGYAKPTDKTGPSPNDSAYEHANENASFKREGFKWPWQKKSSTDVKQKSDDAKTQAQKEADKAKKEAEKVQKEAQKKAEKAKREAQREAERLKREAQEKLEEGKVEVPSGDVKLDEAVGKFLEK